MSHPVWVCGLKLPLNCLLLLCVVSHPVWVCGLKHHPQNQRDEEQSVTPYMGVWIETDTFEFDTKEHGVTPCMGVWIETFEVHPEKVINQVTPCMGVWIETEQKHEHQQ